MCLIVRTMIAQAKLPAICADKPTCLQNFDCNDFDDCSLNFPNPSNAENIAVVADIISKVYQNIDCPGFSTSTKICAINGDSYNNPNGWVFALKPLWIKINGENSKESFDRLG